VGPISVERGSLAPTGGGIGGGGGGLGEGRAIVAEEVDSEPSDQEIEELEGVQPHIGGHDPGRHAPAEPAATAPPLGPGLGWGWPEEGVAEELMESEE